MTDLHDLQVAANAARIEVRLVTPDPRYVMQLGDGTYWTYGRIVCLCGEYHIEWRRV